MRPECGRDCILLVVSVGMLPEVCKKKLDPSDDVAVFVPVGAYCSPMDVLLGCCHFMLPTVITCI